MGEIHKLTKDGKTLFPATTTDAVAHPQTRTALSNLIHEFNVSELFPKTEGYTLESAINILNSKSINITQGTKVMFLDEDNNFQEWVFSDSEPTNTSSWFRLDSWYTETEDYTDDLEANLITDALRKTEQNLSDAEVTQVKKNLKIPEAVVKVTWAELKVLKENSKLVPGQYYRIYNFKTTTGQEDTISANHQFDIIIEALTENELIEEAKVCQHEEDTYFSNTALEAWEIKYCLENDTNRFAWANNSGYGVIYYMKDEWNNECPYDFKNIQFYNDTRDKFFFTFSWVNENNEIEDLTLRQDLLSDEGFAYGTHGNTIKPYYNEKHVQQLNNITIVGNHSYDGGFFYGYYNNSFGNDCFNNSFGDGCYCNSFGNNFYNNSFGNNCQSNSFGNDCFNNSFGSRCCYNSLGNYCYSNSFENDCNYNSFGDGCCSNSFENECNHNSFGNSCYSNSFGISCYSNSFGNGCRSNSLGNGCYSNSFEGECFNNSLGNYCYSNSFGNECNYNSFGEDCVYNSFGNGCNHNSFGDGCYCNSFENSCNNNSFGGYCNYNSFGNECDDNNFGDKCHSNSFGNYCYKIGFFDGDAYSLKYNNYYSSDDESLNYVQNNKFGDGCGNLIIYNDTITSTELGESIQNLNIAQGFSSISIDENENKYPEVIKIETVGQDYEIKIARNSKGEVKIYCEADLIG